MMMRPLPTEEQSAFEQGDLLWLRIAALDRLVVALVTVGVIWYVYVAAVQLITQLHYWGGAVLLCGSSLLAYRTARVHFLVAVLLCVVGMSGAIFWAFWLYDEPLVLFLLPLPAASVSLLVGPRLSFLLSLLLGALLYLVMSLSPLAFPLSFSGLLYLLLFATVILQWVGMHPLRMTTYWAWAEYLQANQRTQQVREHRAQLVQAVKQLDIANQQLSLTAAELERARNAANEARRVKAEFAANISHEMRTPLNLIVGFSEMMIMAPQTYGNLPLPAPYRGDLQAVHRNAKHLASLIDDVLDLTQIEAGQMAFIRTPLALAEVINEACAMVAALFATQKLWLKTEIADNLPMIEADRTRIRQVLINLLSNAARYTKQGGVQIRATADDQAVLVAVTDTGVGIEPHELDKVFQEFSQLDGTIRNRFGGSGLGLTISKKFIELHGGWIKVASQPGVGSTFTFMLPCHDGAHATTGLPPWETWAQIAKRDKAAKTVAVVGEARPVLHFLERYLEGYQVIPVANVQAVAHLAAHYPLYAIILLAPSAAALELLRSAQAAYGNLPTIVCALQAHSLCGEPANVLLRLAKPVTQEQFLTALRQLDERVETLLIVDDEPEVVRLLTRMVGLAARRFRVLKAYTGAQALTLLQEQKPDALILDLWMPEMDGYALLAQIEADEAWRKLPVIVISAAEQTETISYEWIGITSGDRLALSETLRTLKVNLDHLRPLRAF